MRRPLCCERDRHALHAVRVAFRKVLPHPIVLLRPSCVYERRARILLMDSLASGPIDERTDGAALGTPSAQSTTSRLPHPVLAPVILGRPTLIRSSASLAWRGVLLEKHVCSPGERPGDDSLDRPVLAMLCSALWRGEKKAANGTMVTTSKTLGALTVVPKGPVPAARTLNEADVLYCAFDEPFLSSVWNETDGRLPFPPHFRSGLYDHAVSKIVKLLLDEIESDGASGALYAESLSCALAIRFLRLGEHVPARVRGHAGLPRAKLRRIQEYIQSRLGTDLTLEELAAEVGYSRSHFLRLFRASTGLTPHHYVFTRRIELARRLLGQAHITIGEVAHLCGFSSPAHLTVAFRKECGITPTEYRRHL